MDQKYDAFISYKHGDRDNAVLAANAITPENILDGPVVPEQFYAMNRALGSFKGRNEYLPTAKIATGNTTSYAVTTNQRYACTLQEEKFTALSNASEEIT